jgi:HEAT repeat protein
MRNAAIITVLAMTGSVLAQAGGGSENLRVKVVLLTRTTTYVKMPSGVVVPRRSTLEPFMVEDIKAAFKEVSDQAASVTGGKLRITLDYSEDAEHLTAILNSSDFGQPASGKEEPRALALGGRDSLDPLARRLLWEGAGTLSNSDRFQAIDNVFRGPYSASFVIHSGLDGPTQDFTVDGQRLTVLSWNSFSRLAPKEVLKSQVLDQISGLRPELSGLKPNQTEIPAAFGEVEAVTSGEVTTVRSKGVIPRGGVNVLRLPASDSARPGISFKFRSTSQEPLALTLADEKGRPLYFCLLKGEMPGHEGTFGRVFKKAEGTWVNPGSEWTDYSISLNELQLSGVPAFVQLGPPPVPYERGPLEQTTFEYQQVKTLSSAEALQEIRKSELSESEKLVLDWVSSLNTGWDDTKILKFNEFLSSERSWIRATAMDAAASKPDPRLIGPLRAVAGGGSIGDTYLACRALAEQGPDGQAGLVDVLKKGPFETNRRFAAEFLKGDLDRTTLNLVSVLLVNRGWRTRLTGVEILGRSKAREDQVAMAGALDFRGEPHPTVRLRIAQSLDVTFDLAARRLLYSGVNDPSQWVRATALSRLLETPFDEIRAEAIRGVKDDSATVRVMLLNAMQKSPKAEYRASLRQAVVDPSGKVRAAALLAFSTQAEPVAQGEIENTLTDNSEDVQLALIQLGSSGKFKLPAAVVERLKQSTHESVRKAAETL